MTFVFSSFIPVKGNTFDDHRSQSYPCAFFFQVIFFSVKKKKERGCHCLTLQQMMVLFLHILLRKTVITNHKTWS